MREILEAAKQVLAGKSKQLNEGVMSEIDLAISTVFEEGGDQAAAVDELINQFDLTKEEADQLVRDWLMNTEDDGIEESADDNIQYFRDGISVDKDAQPDEYHKIDKVGKKRVKSIFKKDKNDQWVQKQSFTMQEEADESTDLKPGDKIFVGLANKNGTGYSGVLERIEGNKVIFRGDGGRLFQGRLDLATKQEDTSEAVDPSVKSRMNALASMARKNVEKTKDITRQISGEKGAKNVEHGFRSAIKRDYKRNDRDVQEGAPLVVGKKSEAWEKGWDAGYSERTAVPANPYPKDSPEFKEFFRGASTGYDDYQYEKNESVARKGKSVTENKEYSVAQEDGEWVVKDASGNIVDTATDKLGALQAARDLNSMKQSNRRVVTGKQPQADVEEDYHPGKYGNTMDQIVAKIAATHLGFETLETQKSDRLDFKEVAVWRAKEALEDAFKAGFEKGQSKAGVKQVGEASKFKVPPMRVKMSTQDAIKYTSEVLGELDPDHQYWPGASFDDVYNAAKAADVPDWQARMLASSMHDVKTKNSEGVKEAYDWPGHTVEVDWGPEEGDEALTAEERQWLEANLPAYQELADTVNDNNIDEHEVVRAMMDAQEVFEHGYLPDGIQGADKALTRAKDAVYNYFNDDEDGELNYRRKMRSRDRFESVDHFAKFLG